MARDPAGYLSFVLSVTTLLLVFVINRGGDAHTYTHRRMYN